MTIEELTAELEKATASIAKLEADNKKLKADEKAAKTAADKAAEEAETAKTEAAEKAGDVETVRKQLEKQYSKQINDLSKANEAATAQLNTLLIDNAISNHLNAANVAPQFRKAVTAMIKADAKLINGEAMAGDQPLADYITAFITGDDGKHFVTAPVNSGAGAPGSSGVKVPEKWNATRYAEMKASGDAAGAAAFAAAHGKKF